MWARSLGSLAIAVVATGLFAGRVAAETTVHLVAAPVTKPVTLPSGATVPVPMWGYAQDGHCPLSSTDTNCFDGIVNNGVVVTVPGPRIVVPAGDTSLTVVLTNLLPEPTSLVIPGLPFEAVPERNADGRVRSMTPETAAGATRSYAFTGLRPGTFLYQSGSHPAVQVQMGLYGAVTQDAAAGSLGVPAQAYSGVAYDHEAVLVYSEIDPALHEAVSAGTYGTPEGPTSTINYKPSLFLVNGASYTNESVAAIAAGTAGQVTLLRMLNACLRTHVPQLDNGSLKIVAEDGNKLPFGKDQAGVMLAAGKTHDALWTPAATGVYSMYDRMLALNAPRQGSAGMLAKLKIAASGAPADGDPVAVNDSFGGVQGGPPIAGNVLANDTNAATAELVAYPHGGLLTMLASGGFTYTPSGTFAGIDEFTYRAVNAASVQSAPALVTLTVTAVAHTPVATALVFGVDQDGNASVTLSGTDADGDALKYYLTALPSHGTLSFINPVTRVETPLAAADLYPAATRKAIPAGVVIYTPAPAYVGTDTFHFLAFDGGVAAGSYSPYSTPAAVGAPCTRARTRRPQGSSSRWHSAWSAMTAQPSPPRWTLRRTSPTGDPGRSDPHTLAVSFHKSYMPVVAAGDQSRRRRSIRPSGTSSRCCRRRTATATAARRSRPGQTSVTITASKLPLPTARIRVRVFQDNAPLDGMWSADEPGLAGFQVTIDDAGGTYGMSGGHQSTDAFGNKIGTTYQPCSNPEGCTSYEVGQLGDGFVLTDADGYAVIENLVMGKCTVKVRPAASLGADDDDRGQVGIDAWVKPSEPQFFTEFRVPGPHVFVGFTRAETSAGLSARAPAPSARSPAA